MFVLVGASMVNSADPEDVSSGLWVALFFGFCSLIFALMLIRGAPKIVISPNGLRLVHLFNDTFWNWADVGPFAASVQKVMLIKIFYACAYTNHHHALLAAREEAMVPNLVEADIHIPLQMLLVGENMEAAQDFVDRLNVYRDRYGRPDIEVDEHTAEEAYDTLQRKRKKQRLFYKLWVALAIIIVLLLYVIFDF